MVLTSHGELGVTGYHTGMGLEEFTMAYYVLKDAGMQITLASPQGGPPPIDPRSGAATNTSECVERFRHDQDARVLLADTLTLRQVDAADFDGAFYPGGYGTMWDLAEDIHSAALIAALVLTGKLIALVGHGPAALRHVRDPSGRALVDGRNVTSFSNSEERSTGLFSNVPFSLQDELIRLGGRYSKGPDRSPFVVSDGVLITGQNPNSSADAARTLLRALHR